MTAKRNTDRKRTHECELCGKYAYTGPDGRRICFACHDEEGEVQPGPDGHNG